MTYDQTARDAERARHSTRRARAFAIDRRFDDATPRERDGRALRAELSSNARRALRNFLRDDSGDVPQTFALMGAIMGGLALYTAALAVACKLMVPSATWDNAWYAATLLLALSSVLIIPLFAMRPPRRKRETPQQRIARRLAAKL